MTENTTPSAEPKEAPLPAFRRTVESAVINHENQPMFVLRDTEGLTDQVIVISPPAMMFVALMDGQNTLSDIKKIIFQQTGQMPPDAPLKDMVEQFKKFYFLETPETMARRKVVLEEFEKAPARKAVLAGLAYPDDRLQLAQFLGSFFKNPAGPQKDQATAPLKKEPPLGLVCPHIDITRGGPVYAHSFQALSEFPAPDIVVALGVAHAGPSSPWVILDKNYETPYGPMEADRELAAKLKACLWYEAGPEEFVHRNEHSLEFASLWMKNVWRDNAPKFVPVLTSFFERFSPDKAPTGVETVEGAIVKMGEVLKNEQAAGKKIMILAAVDFSHVGPRFGGKPDMTPEHKKKIEELDRKALEEAGKMDPAAFYESIVDADEACNVCGLSALYTALRLMNALRGDAPAKGNLLSYMQAPDEGGGIVSFASMIFEKETSK